MTSVELFSDIINLYKQNSANEFSSPALFIVEPHFYISLVNYRF